MASDACNVPTCNLQTLTCQLSPVAEGTTCDDGLACTRNDRCNVDGQCRGTNVTCDDRNDCTTDRCSEPLGRCVFDPRPNVGATCHSNNLLCFENNKCSRQGVCVKGTPKSCPSTNECNVGTCVRETGECTTAPVSSGTCDDGNPCTSYSYCSAGSCVGVPTVRVDNPCFTSTCNQETGVVSQTLNPGFCYISGMCIPAGTSNPQDGSMVCDPDQDTTAYTPQVTTTMRMVSNRGVVMITECSMDTVGIPCSNDLDLCWDWICSDSGQCVRDTPIQSLQDIYEVHTLDSVVNCLSPDTCHSNAVCEPTTGVCNPTIFADGTSCTLDIPFVASSQCVKGTCTPKVFYPATAPSTECAGRPDHTICEDNNPYTPYSVCIDEQCLGVGTFLCPNDNPCLEFFYDPHHGCVSIFNNGAPCVDENQCISGAVCVSGQCAPLTGHPTDCNDDSGTTCTVDSCFPGSGCVIESDIPCASCASALDCPEIPCKRAVCGVDDNTCRYVDDDTQINGCADGLFCSGNPFCYAGTCHQGTPPSCDDGNECTEDQCSPDTDSCTHTILTGESCTSNDLCVETAVCNSIGRCQPTSTVHCDEAPQCKISVGCQKDSRMCEYINMPDYLPCTDTDPCTRSAHCLSGRCVKIDPMVCEPPDVCHEVGTCTWDQAECFYTNKPDGFPCGPDSICSSGSCQPLSLTCDHIVRDSQCQTVVYNTTTRACEIHNMPARTPCDTGNPVGDCSKHDTCNGAGQCVDRYAYGKVCRDALTECDKTEVCTGSSDDCPEDAFEWDNTPCQSESFCDISVCRSGVCEFSHDRTCHPSTEECDMTYCDRFLEVCATIHVADGTPCETEMADNVCVHHQHCALGKCISTYQPSTYECGVNQHCSGHGPHCVLDPKYDCSMFSTECSMSAYNFNLDRCDTLSMREGQSCTILTEGDCGSDFRCSSGSCVATSPLFCGHMDDDCGRGILSPDGCDCVYQYTNPLCHPDHCDGGCTYAYTHWQSYNEYTVIPAHRVTWADDFASQQLCGKTTYQWMTEISKGNAWRKLAQSFITAYLNVNTNDACVTGNLAQTMDTAAQLLLECQTSLSVSSPDAGVFRDLVTAIDSYNTGATGPGNCLSDVDGPRFSSRRVVAHDHYVSALFIKPLNAYTDYYSDHTLYELALSSNKLMRKGTGFRDSQANETTCVSGDWDYALAECICYYGWTGENCDTCAAPEDPEKMFLCVPTRLENNPYLLRQIPRNKVQYYLGLDRLTLPFVSIPNSPAFYPGTDGYDCFCNHQRSHNSLTISRNIAVSVTNNQDLYLYIDVLESDLGVCELTWEGNSSIPETTIIEVIIEEPNTNPWMIGTIVFASALGLVLILLLATLISRYVNSKTLPSATKISSRRVHLRPPHKRKSDEKSLI